LATLSAIESVTDEMVDVLLRVGDDGLFQSREMMAERALYVALPVLEVCSPTVGSLFEGTN
jgi:hypothetical protein